MYYYVLYRIDHISNLNGFYSLFVTRINDNAYLIFIRRELHNIHVCASITFKPITFLNIRGK